MKDQLYDFKVTDRKSSTEFINLLGKDFLDNRTP
jgi:hypothetical protein